MPIRPGKALQNTRFSDSRRRLRFPDVYRAEVSARDELRAGRIADVRAGARAPAEFPGETTEPVEIVIDGGATSPGVRTRITRLRERLAREELFGRAVLESKRGR